ncbi:MAG: site-2 protease family protein [Lentisphaeria bacterium]|nr:site-2 protease family protein [Lentisphaeria bacterium]
MLEFFSIILKVIFIVFFFGFCVFIHEFGHLLVALWQGLHVEKFSIGMGPKLWGFTYRGVEYVVSWLPFGGYVSLPQLDPTDNPVTSDEKPLPHAGPKARALTAFAGPFFNVLFGFFLAAIMWGVGLWRPAPASSVTVAAIPAYLSECKEVPESVRILSVNGEAVPFEDGMTWAEYCYWAADQGQVVSEELVLRLAPAEEGGEIAEVTVHPEMNEEYKAGIRVGDRFTKVNGKAFTAGADQFQKEYVYGNTGHVTLVGVRDGQPLEFTYSPQKNPLMEGLGFPFFEAENPVCIADVLPGSPAAEAGMRSGDQLLEFAGKNVIGPRDFLEKLSGSAGQSVAVVVAREGNEQPAMRLLVPAGENVTEKELGLSFYVFVSSVMAGSPAADVGLQFGDRFLKLTLLDETATTELSSMEVRDVQSFREFIRKSGGNPVRVDYLRNGRELTAVARPISLEPGAYALGVVITGGLPKTIQHVNPWTQFSEVMGTTCRTLGLLFNPLTSRAKSLVTGKPREVSRTQIGVRHMSGPLGIVQALWYRIKAEGYRGGFSFIILITFSLAFMNLLPLPVLDGGHIVFAGIEAITRKRIPAVFFKYIYNTFAILLIALMLYITLFDGRRILKYSGLADKKTDKAVAVPEKSAEP